MYDTAKLLGTLPCEFVDERKVRWILLERAPSMPGYWFTAVAAGESSPVKVHLVGVPESVLKVLQDQFDKQNAAAKVPAQNVANSESGNGTTN